jgi:hypothetical protein
LSFLFIDRLGQVETLDPLVGEQVGDLLRRHLVPSPSVMVTRGDEVVGDAHEIVQGDDYRAHLIEGYDIGAIRTRLREGMSDRSPSFLKRRIVLEPGGDLVAEADFFDEKSIAEHVIGTVTDTVVEYGLIRENDRIVIGLSGGVDIRC